MGLHQMSTLVLNKKWLLIKAFRPVQDLLASSDEPRLVPSKHVNLCKLASRSRIEPGQLGGKRKRQLCAIAHVATDLRGQK